VPDAAAISTYEAVVTRLIGIRHPTPAKAITLDWEGIEHFRQVELLADALVGLPTIGVEMKGHLGKMTGLFARLCLTFHAVECASEGRITDSGQLEPEVRGDTARRVRDFMVRYLIPSAARFYDSIFRDRDPEIEMHRDIANAILARGMTSLTKRDLTRNWPASWTKAPGAMDRFLEAFRLMNWLGEPKPEGRKNTLTWPVNPMVHVRFAERAKTEAKRRAAEHARIKSKLATAEQNYPRGSDKSTLH
jgi:hypothetical protein